MKPLTRENAQIGMKIRRIKPGFAGSPQEGEEFTIIKIDRFDGREALIYVLRRGEMWSILPRSYEIIEEFTLTQDKITRKINFLYEKQRKQGIRI